MNIANNRGFTRTPKFGVSSQGERGFIGRVILLIIAVIALKYFLHFDLIEWLKSPKVQEIIQPIISFFRTIYFWLDNFVRNLVTK